MVQVGCDPSLSSIPVLAQRSFADALAELAAWLARPENQREFLLVFLDDQPDIKAWVSRTMKLIHLPYPSMPVLEHPKHRLRHVHAVSACWCAEVSEHQDGIRPTAAPTVKSRASGCIPY